MITTEPLLEYESSEEDDESNRTAHQRRNGIHRERGQKLFPDMVQ
jgi:hypothetical protein